MNIQNETIQLTVKELEALMFLHSLGYRLSYYYADAYSPSKDKIIWHFYDPTGKIVADRGNERVYYDIDLSKRIKVALKHASTNGFTQ